MKRLLAPTATAILGLALALVISGQPGASELPVLTPGEPAPAFEATDEQGQTHRLADYRGKGVVLEWTNQDCPFVQRHYDSDTMEKLATALGAEEVVWLAVNSTRDNKPEETEAWKSQQGFVYPTLQDADGTIGRAYGARTTPHMFVIDAEGVLRYNGAIDNDPRGRLADPMNYVAGATQAVLAGNDPAPGLTEPYGCSVKYAKR
jgi:peroxiredoxin